MLVLRLTDEQIDALYNHFEHSDPAPAGIALDKRGLKHTLGRVWQWRNKPEMKEIRL